VKSTMISARAWKWPVLKNRLFYNKEHVVRIINPPTVAGNIEVYSYLVVTFLNLFIIDLEKQLYSAQSHTYVCHRLYVHPSQSLIYYVFLKYCGLKTGYYLLVY